METDVRFAAIGDNCMDVYDKTGEVYPGGNPVNVAVHIARLGGRASYIGVVGDDAYGGIRMQKERLSYISYLTL